MEGIGLLVVIAFVLLAIAIVNNCRQSDVVAEGFIGAGAAKPIPKATSLETNKEPKGLTDMGDLPAAPIVGLAETNSLPFQDPALAKATEAQLNELRKDMDGFASFEMPGLDGKSDPAVNLPLTRFKGDYQRIKDETLTLARNPGLQSQLTLDDLQGMAANLRFLQRTYRLYAANSMVPDAKGGLSKFGIDGVEGFTSDTFQEEEQSLSEGFTTSTDSTTPLSSDELNLLSQKLAVEIARLQASGTTDPVINARVAVLTKMRQSVVDIINQLKNGTIAASQVPITVKDYKNFLPSLGNTTSSIDSLDGSTDASGNETTDVSGTGVVGSFSVTYKYSGKNDLEAIKAMLGGREHTHKWKDIVTNHPGWTGSRGEFDSTVREMDVAGFMGADARRSAADLSSWSGRPPAEAATTPGAFDWKKKVEEIVQNIRRIGMNPNDFGALAQGASVGQDYSWRGHAKMMCSRLATAADPGVPEQMGCPPVSWKGWRL